MPNYLRHNWNSNRHQKLKASSPSSLDLPLRNIWAIPCCLLARFTASCDHSPLFWIKNTTLLAPRWPNNGTRPRERHSITPSSSASGPFIWRWGLDIWISHYLQRLANSGISYVQYSVIGRLTLGKCLSAMPVDALAAFDSTGKSFQEPSHGQSLSAKSLELLLIGFLAIHHMVVLIT